MAQRYAEDCRGLIHNSAAGRNTRRFGSCGENIFISTHKVIFQYSFIIIMIITHKVPWTFAIKSWFSEKDLFRYGHSGNNLTEVSGSRYLHRHYLLTITKVGHYTQMVWSSSHKVGCGFAKCVGSENSSWKKYYAYVCNYCPQ